MKKRILLAGILLVAIVFSAFYLSAQQRLVANRAFLIDFASYRARVASDLEALSGYSEQIVRERQGIRGLADENPDYQMTDEDWALFNWVVELNSSASSVFNNVNSYVTNVESNYWSEKYGQIYDGQNIIGFQQNEEKWYQETSTADGAGTKGSVVLGVRIHFPSARQNAWAKIKPPFEIAAFATSGTNYNENNGVIYNVGQVKSVSAWVKGRNYQNSLAVRMKDRDNTITEYFLGDLQFDNWRLMTWVNPNYIENPRDRLLTRLPLYPHSLPYVKFDSFVVYRQMDQIGGDFILYIKDVQVEYDKAVDDDDSEDINDEAVWGILQRRERIRREREVLKLAETKALLERERAKLAPVEE